MNKYAYILCACCKYLPELVANLNSLDAVGNTHDVHFWDIKYRQALSNNVTNFATR